MIWAAGTLGRQGRAERQAQIGQLQARLAYSDRQMDRLTQLAQQNSASRTQLDEITAERDVYRLQLTSAHATRDRVRYDLQRTRVVAPFDGQWVERYQQGGEYTAIGGPLGRLVNTTQKEVRARAPVSVAPYVSNGMLLGVKAQDRTSEHPVRAIIPVGDEVSRSLEIRVILEDEKLLVGSAVRVAVPTAFPQNMLAIPRDALVIRRDMMYVFRVVDNNDEIVTEQNLELQSGQTADVKFRCETPGLFSATVSNRLGTQQAQRSIDIQEVAVEFVRTERNMESLRQWANLSDGVTLKVEDCHSLDKVIEELKISTAPQQQRPRSVPAGINGWTMLLLFGCLCTEWLLRKRWGLA